MDEYLGNTSLLDRYLVAFFASRSSTAEIAERALRWTEDICHTDKVVISGFHSPLEKEVLRVLIEHKHPVIIALGRDCISEFRPTCKLPSMRDDCYSYRFVAILAIVGNPRRFEIGKLLAWQTRSISHPSTKQVR